MIFMNNSSSFRNVPRRPPLYLSGCRGCIWKCQGFFKRKIWYAYMCLSRNIKTKTN